MDQRALIAMSVALGEHVLEQVGEMLDALRIHAPDAPIKIDVRVSRKQLVSSSYRACAEKVATRNGQWGRLGFAIAEHAVATATAPVRAAVNHLKGSAPMST